MEAIISLVASLIVLIFCYFVGRTIEKKHFKNLKQREVALYKKPYINFARKSLKSSKIKTATLVVGEVVIACDRFQYFVSGLKNFFGGNISVYESVLDRGKREAILRMREKAQKLGADIVINTKIETTSIDPLATQERLPRLSILAYGTAIKYDK